MLWLGSNETTYTWIDLLTAVFSGVAAVGGIVALGIAIRALAVSRQAVVIEQLFVAFSEVIAALQEIGRAGTLLGLKDGGEPKSRATLDPLFQRFLAARARVDLACEALGVRGAYTEGVLTLANNFAASVLQADEFGPLSRKKTRVQQREAERGWLDLLSWTPTPEEIEVLSHSITLEDVWQSLELVDTSEAVFADLVDWWASRIVDPWVQMPRSVYYVEAPYLVQTSRLLDDYTREILQPMCELALRRVAGARSRRTPLKST